MGFFCNFAVKTGFNMKRFFILFVLIALVGCQSPVVFSHHEEFDRALWNRFHFIELDVPITDSQQLYDLSIDFTNNGDYPSDYIELNFTIFYASSGMRSRDYTFRLQDNNRQWTGEKNPQGFTSHLPIISGMQFPENGTHRIRIESKMTKFDLPGVVSLNFTIKKSK